VQASLYHPLSMHHEAFSLGVMKKAMLKFFLKFFILVIISVSLFVVGYVQFFVPLGKCGVFVSKTNGYHTELIRHDGFVWKWQALIPTNSKILLFSLQPLSVQKQLSGKLEHTDEYISFLKNKPNFSWQLKTLVLFDIKQDKLISSLKESNTKDADAFLESMQELAENAVALAIEDAILFYQENEKRCNKFLFKKQLKNNIERLAPKLLTPRIMKLEVDLPDFHTYRVARLFAQEYARAKADILNSKIDRLKEIQQNIEELSKDIESSILSLEKVLAEEKK